MPRHNKSRDQTYVNANDIAWEVDQRLRFVGTERQLRVFILYRHRY